MSVKKVPVSLAETKPITPLAPGMLASLYTLVGRRLYTESPATCFPRLPRSGTLLAKSTLCRIRAKFRQTKLLRARYPSTGCGGTGGFLPNEPEHICKGKRRFVYLSLLTIKLSAPSDSHPLSLCSGDTTLTPPGHLYVCQTLGVCQTLAARVPHLAYLA
jgi:hypothetical protein